MAEGAAGALGPELPANQRGQRTPEQIKRVRAAGSLDLGLPDESTRTGYSRAGGTWNEDNSIVDVAN